VIAAKAIAGDYRFLRMIWERIEGKAVQPIGNPDGTPLNLGGLRPEDAGLLAEALRIFEANDSACGPKPGPELGPEPVDPAADYPRAD
jgi:hypothetical protein